MLVVFLSILSCLSNLAALWSRVGKGLTSWLSCVRDIFLCFCRHFPIRCPGSGVVLYCIDS